VERSEGDRIFGKVVVIWDGRTNDIRKTRWNCVTCLDVAQDRERWGLL
jgi:hypothetical protein